MLPQLYLKLCVQSWSFLAQAVPASGAPAAAATTAPAATAPVTTASVVPVTAATSLPVTTVPPTVPITAATGVPGIPVQVPAGAGAPPQLDLNLPAAAHGPVHDWLHSLVLFVYFLICIGLIGCVLFQTTKNEGGLSGVIGGQVSSSLFRGKKSSEEHLTSWTNWLAIAFIVFSMLIWLLFGRGA